MASVHAARSELAEEHRRVMSLVGRLEAMPDPAGLEPLLDELHDLLVDHFAHEQFPGGLYEQLGAYGPRYHEEIRALVGDHCRILSAMGRLRERARGATRADAETLRDVRDTVGAIRAHEEREHALASRLAAS